MFLLPSPMCPVSSLFVCFPAVCWHFLFSLHSWACTKALSRVIVKIIVLWDEDSGRFLFPSFCCHHSRHFMFGNTNRRKYLRFLEENNFNFNVMDNYEFCVVLFNTGSGHLLLGNTLGTLLENVSLLFSL